MNALQMAGMRFPPANGFAEQDGAIAATGKLATGSHLQLVGAILFLTSPSSVKENLVTPDTFSVEVHRTWLLEGGSVNRLKRPGSIATKPSASPKVCFATSL